MKLRGLRAQLCLWHGALMALTLLALAGFTFLLLSQVLYSRADAALLEFADNTARQIAITLARSGGEGGAGVQPDRFLSTDLRSWGRYVQVIDPRGNVVDKSDALSTHPLRVHPDPLRRGLQGQTTLETVHGLGEHPVRVVTVPVLLGNRVPYLVQAGTSLEGVDAALQRAGTLLLLLTPSVFVVALLGGWLLVGRALRRVDLLTRTALQIQGTDLQRRIRHEGPEDEIGRLAQAFDQMIARLDRSFQQIRRFSADASHELKTPLTAIRGEAEVALMGDLTPEEYRRSMRSILESAERMSEVVESLLLLARVDAGQELLRREPVELGDLVLRAIESLEPLAARDGIALLVDEIEDVTVKGDALWLSQVVTNLLTNGIKYTPSGGSVTVELARRDGQAVLCVRDTGIGIPEKHLPHIFDRFYRVEEGRARLPGSTAGGTGLGLSITRWAVEAHGGTISVESEVNEGSAFRVSLPLAGSETTAAGATATAALAGSPESASAARP